MMSQPYDDVIQEKN